MKLINKISTLALAGIISMSLFTTYAEAKVVGRVLEDNDGKQYEFSSEELTDSFLMHMRNPQHPGTALFSKYSSILKNGEIASFLDDTTGYIDYTDIYGKFLASLRSGKTFNIDYYTESAEAKRVVTKQLSKVIKNNDGSIKIVTVDERPADFYVKSIE